MDGWLGKGMGIPEVEKPDGFFKGNFSGIHVQGVFVLIGISMEVRNYDGVRTPPHVYITVVIT